MRRSTTLDILYTGTLPPHPGGSAISGAAILQGFAERGHRVRSLGPLSPPTRDQAVDWDQSHAHLNVSRFEVESFETELQRPAPEGYRALESAGVQLQLQRLLDERRPDLLLAGRETFAQHVAPFATNGRLPFVQRIAGGVVLGIVEGSLPAAERRRVTQSMSQAALIVSPAAHMRDKLATIGLPATRVIPNTVDTARFSPGREDPSLRHRLCIPPQAPVVAFVGRVAAIKRPLDFVGCAEEIARRRPDVVFLLVGNGTMLAEVERAIVESGLEQSFRRVGWIDNGELPDWFRLADVVVVPSRQDTQPRVYLETLAAGTVLVASDIAAVRDVLGDDSAALLHPVGDVAAMAQQVLLALEDDALRRRLRAAGPKLALRHTPESTIPLWEGHLSETVARVGSLAQTAGSL